MATCPPPFVELLSGNELANLSASVKQSVTERDFTFVVPFPEEFQSECSICHVTLKNPQIVTCCGNRFCHQCIGRVAGTCPLCKAQNIQYFPDKMLERQISQRKVYCPLRNSGCMWTGEMYKMTDHLDIYECHGNIQPCLFLPVTCKYCGSFVRLKIMSAHLVNCGSRPRGCHFCGDEVSSECLRDHFRSCDAAPVHCTNVPCTMVVKKSTLNHHLGNCKWALMECKFKHAGCYARVYRSDMEKHLELNVKQHMDLLGQELEKQKQQVAKLEAEKRVLLETMKNGEAKMKKEVRKKGPIQYLIVSDLPEDACEDEQMLKSRFGMYGEIYDVNLYVGIVEYCSEDSYQRALNSSKEQGIRLCRELLRVDPVYRDD